MRKLLLLLLTVLVMTVGTAAYEIPEDFAALSLEDALSEFREAYGLHEENFSLCYYNTATGEEYAWNETWFSIAASTYKLPLNMYFYEMEQAGEITGDTCITWTGQTLDHIHEQSIVNSNNELSEALMYYWGDHTTYKENLRKYFTMEDEEISPLYWQANWFCTDMMMDCLKYLYENRENFEELIDYMKQAMPGQYFKRGVPDYEVAHKYGAVQTYHNDVGIIYTPQPFLLVVYTQGVGERVCADASALITAYHLWKSEQKPAELQTEEIPAVQPGRQLPMESVKREEPVTAPEVGIPAKEPVPAAEKPADLTGTVNVQRTSAMSLAAGFIGAMVLLGAAFRRMRRRK